jgi:tetratricopeptide (TPR) repeat protein
MRSQEKEQNNSTTSALTTSSSSALPPASLAQLKSEYTQLNKKIDEADVISDYKNGLDLTEKALAKLNEYIKLGGKDFSEMELSEQHSNRGYYYYKLGKLTEAIEATTIATKINSKDEMALSNLSYYLLESKDYKNALANGLEAIKLDTKLADPHVNVAESLANLGNFKEALDHYQQAIRKYTKNRNEDFNYADIQQSIERAKVLIEQSQSQASSSSSSSVTHDYVSYLSKCDALQEQIKKILSLLAQLKSEYMELCVKYDKAIANNDYIKAQALTDEAIKKLNEYIKLGGRDLSRIELSSKYVARGYCFSKLGNLAKAIAATTFATEKNPLNAKAFSNLSSYQLKTEDYANAIVNGMRAIKLDSTYADPHVNIAESYANLKDFNEAINHYKQAISSYNKKPGQELNFADMQKSIEMVKVLIEESQSQASLSSSSSSSVNHDYAAYLNKCNVLLEEIQKILSLKQLKSEYEQLCVKYDQGSAIDDYTKALDLTGEAIKKLDKYIKLGGKDFGEMEFSKQYVARGYCYSQLGNLAKAIAAATFATEKNPQNAKAFSNLSSYQLKAKDYENAIASGMQAIEFGIENAYPHVNIAESYANLRDFKKAIGHYKQAMSDYNKKPRQEFNFVYLEKSIERVQILIEQSQSQASSSSSSSSSVTPDYASYLNECDGLLEEIQNTSDKALKYVKITNQAYEIVKNTQGQKIYEQLYIDYTDRHLPIVPLRELHDRLFGNINSLLYSSGELEEYTMLRAEHIIVPRKDVSGYSSSTSSSTPANTSGALITSAISSPINTHISSSSSSSSLTTVSTSQAESINSNVSLTAVEKPLVGLASGKRLASEREEEAIYEAEQEDHEMQDEVAQGEEAEAGGGKKAKKVKGSKGARKGKGRKR